MFHDTTLAPGYAANTPFMRGLARFEAAEARISNLSDRSPSQVEAEEKAYGLEWDAVQDLRPSDWREFGVLFLLAARIGQLGEGDTMTKAMVEDAKRLLVETGETALVNLQTRLGHVEAIARLLAEPLDTELGGALRGVASMISDSNDSLNAILVRLGA